ncbi:MAG: hypothetical protein HY678_04235 [Chloroflexi bacterium]|nr:hypothetical protein [Chloroflexota bacterium]
MLAYSKCMRDHGISNFPDPSSSGGLAIDASTLGVPPDSPQFQSADEACKQYMPNAGEPQAPPPEVREAALKYSQCMRDHGISNFPDPLPSGGLAVDGNAVNMGSPQFKAADEACREYLPGGGQGGTLSQGGSQGGGGQ